jgi:methylase of polypeptide subunit release factors
VAIDIGCGSGVFTSILAKSNNKVIATDFAKASLSLTEKLLKNNSCANYDLIQLDLTREEIPKADFAIAIGIAPYIEDMEIFLSNILPNTEKLYFNILDKKNLLNRIRANITFLDVRNYYYHSVEQIKEIAKSHNFSIVRCDNLASGYMIELTLNKEK